jgi:hypothetical protein
MLAYLFDDGLEEEGEDRLDRMRRYTSRDDAIGAILARFLGQKLIADPAFRPRFERALTETDSTVVCRLLFQERDDWMTRRAVADAQKRLELAPGDIQSLEDAVETLLPKLRRGKIRSVARARALADQRATHGRLTHDP